MRKLNEEVEDLKQHLEIVPDEDDDVYTEANPLTRKVPVVDYEIVNFNNKPHYKIICADVTHQLYVKVDAAGCCWLLLSNSAAEKNDAAKSSKDENIEKQKLEEQHEAEELKKNLEIVADDEDDVFVNVTPLSSKPLIIMDYKIYKKGKKEHFQIIRANGNHQMYLTFSIMLKNFDREDLEVLWKIVKDRFKESQLKEVLDTFLWHTLKVMFEHTVEDSVWKHQKGPKGLARVKN
nr:hypothetical protein [Tanacetum cinerariifolium]